MADYVFGEPMKLEPPANIGTWQYGPSLSADGLELYFAASENGPTDIQAMTRTTTEDDWGEPISLGPAVNSATWDWTPRISADGLELYFVSNREGTPWAGFQIYASRRQSTQDPWQPAENLGPMVNSGQEQTIGSISSNGLELYYSNDQTMRVASRKTKDDAWAEIKDINPMTQANYTVQGFNPAISPGGLHLLYAAGPPVGLGSRDIWMLSRASINDNWGIPVNVGSPISNIGKKESEPWISYDGLSVLYTSGGDIFQIAILSGADFAPIPENAWNPIPKNRAVDWMYNGLVLSWSAGRSAKLHDLYVGLSLDDIENATLDSATYVGRQIETSYALDNPAFAQTYYWRVDEVNAAPDNTVLKGDVWSFTVEPFSIPVETISVAGSSSHADNMLPENTINGVGLNELNQHSTDPTEMWLSRMGDPTPSIQYEFDKAYKLHELWVWNSNQPTEAVMGLGAKDVVIEYSTDGTEWLPLESVAEFAQATSSSTYTANTIVDFGGIVAKSVKITINAGHGVLPQYGLSAVRFFYIPTFPKEPQPADGDTTEAVNVVLSWRTGREAASHQLYLGTDAANLTLLGATTDNSFATDALDYAQTYYWGVIEVNEAETPLSYVSNVWSFTTPAFSVVDSFDQYDNNCNRIFFSWEDGLGHNGDEGIGMVNCDVLPSNGNGSGAVVGYDVAPFAERTIVNIGQSLPLTYDNVFGPSEATLTLAGQDWTTSGVRTLALFFYGQPDNSGQLYVKINDSKVVYNGDAADLTQEQWQQWNIDLTSLDGLQNVTTLTIGVDGADAAGMLYIDDIRLYP